MRYTDSNGREVILRPINNGTIRATRSQPHLEWMGFMDQVLPKLADTVALADAIAFLADKPIEEIDAGLNGDAISKAQDALIEAYSAFCPSRQIKAIQDLVAQARKAEQEQMEKLEKMTLTELSSMQRPS